MDKYTLHIGNSEVVITTTPPGDHYAVIETDDTLSVSWAKVIKKVETDKFVTILSPDPEQTFEALAEQFIRVRAAGGVVTNSRGELLMIHLRGRWDLPKGHIEEGEASSEAALREVKEETGVDAEIVGSMPLRSTLHAYDTYGRWELKSTDWWQMRALSEHLVAQAEEGIKGVEWCGGKELVERINRSYPTIKEVVATLEGKND
jgi:8-oxo-dGTP pyrophosphatase MutT (NUDIX family)